MSLVKGRIPAGFAPVIFALFGIACASDHARGGQHGGSGGRDVGLDSGGAQVDGAPTSLETLALPGFPHSIDVYAVAGAERAMVMLHGGGGNSHLSASNLGLNSNDGAPTQDSVDWTWLVDHRVIAFFPQGRSIPAAPNAFTWTNHVMDSGQDDVAFLQALAAYVREHYQVSEVYLMGHSNGGMMANRMWCESPETFDAYVAIAGPASSYYLDAATPCAPDVPKPYLGIVGDRDNVLGVPGNWEATTWEVNPTLTALSAAAFVNPILIGEWYQQHDRAQAMCGEEPSLDAAAGGGGAETWSACGSRMRLQRVHQGGHPIASLEAAGGYRMLDVVFDFFDGL